MTGSTERVGFGPKHGSCWSDTAAILASECCDRGAILLFIQDGFLSLCVLGFSFLSDPSPIIGYADSLTD